MTDHPREKTPPHQQESLDRHDSSDPGQLRLIDAVGNRLEEALRVIEDQLRFRYRLHAAPRAWRELRHEASQLRRAWGGDRSLGLHRDVAHDPGNPQVTTASLGHTDARSVLQANLARAREAIRSLEEEFRVHDPAVGRSLERLRYRIYAEESAALGILERGDRLRDARLYVLVTSALANGTAEEVTSAAVDGGAQIIQLREKSMPGRELLALAERCRAITAAAGALLIINDDVTIATLCGADGVHLGQEDILPVAARRVLGPQAIIGLSTHAPREATRAAIEGADYIGVGPIFPTDTKKHRAEVGLSYISQAAEATDLPGFAIGNVCRETIDAVLAAGARRIAICTGVIAQDDVRAATQFYRDKLAEADSVLTNEGRNRSPAVDPTPTAEA